MFNEERKQLIVKLVEEYGSISVQELVQKLDTSESTIRRALTELDRLHLITKVHGGAIANSERITKDVSVTVRKEMNQNEKLDIARYAASLIEPEDVVYIDAGTTTGLIFNFLEEKNITLVTNSIEHAALAASRGFTVFQPGGYIKNDTLAIVGHPACIFLKQMHFTKCFMGTNGITLKTGCTTPDATEADIKRTACEQAKNVYVVADHSKFGPISTITFCDFEDAEFITCGHIAEKYKNLDNVHIV